MGRRPAPAATALVAAILALIAVQRSHAQTQDLANNPLLPQKPCTTCERGTSQVGGGADAGPPPASQAPPAASAPTPAFRLNDVRFVAVGEGDVEVVPAEPVALLDVEVVPTGPPPLPPAAAAPPLVYEPEVVDDEPPPFAEEVSAPAVPAEPLAIPAEFELQLNGPLEEAVPVPAEELEPLDLGALDANTVCLEPLVQAEPSTGAPA